MSDLDTGNADALLEMGPIDYIVLEWPGRQPDGSVAPLILDLVDRGLIRILDVADIDAADAFGVFDGASSGLLRDEDLAEAASVLEPGTTAAVLVWENRWAAPVAVALRKSGGQLVASGRIPVQALIASLDALEAGD